METKTKNQIIFYDGNNFSCHNIITYEVQEHTPPMIDATTSYDNQRVYIGGIPEPPTMHFQYGRESIELDPTTMKKIAKYNKEVEVERLDRIITGKKAELELLETKCDFQIRKLEKLKAFVSEFLNQNEYADPCDYIKLDVDENDYDYDYDPSE